VYNLSSPHLKKKRVKPAFKLWFEIGDNYIFGEGAYELLNQVREKGSLSAAAKTLGMSYRYAWSRIKEVEKNLGEPVLKTYKGGKHGGKSEITAAGLALLENYEKLKEEMTKVCRLK